MIEFPPIQFPIDITGTAAVIGVAGGIIFLIWGGIRVAFAMLDKRFYMNLGITTPIDDDRTRSRLSVGGGVLGGSAGAGGGGGGISPPPDPGVFDPPPPSGPEAGGGSGGGNGPVGGPR